ncbi:FAD/NAD(P)-binding protein [Saccharothrix sp. Mg75]|uniref:FAD/NAD(P)-binding protein n=1 Tax=Saccharothrix sp. Mg75 TaxID=3445357 RepID=UPI003EE98D73
MADSMKVVVVGVGASGALAAIHLLRAAADAAGGGTPGGARLELVLVDRSGEFGPGRAYRTADPDHLLNTPAGKMSALADDPDHFVRWSRDRGRDADGTTFLPRGDYGRYLVEALLAEERRAGRAAVVDRVADTATGLSADERGVTVELARRGPVRADLAVLAPGVGGGDPLAAVLPTGSPRYVRDPWAGPLAATDGSPVLVIGTGLSMMDLATTVTRAHPDAVVHAVSRHGLLPRAHRAGRAPAGRVPEPPDRIASLGDLLGFARRCVKADPDRWREFVDRMRPHAPRLWQQLDVDDRRRFLDRVNRYWDVHRHRAAPATHRRVRALVGAGRLHVHRGRVARVREVDDGFDVDLATPGGTRSLRVGWLVNTTGFRQDVGDPLLHDLVAGGTARPDPVGLGVATGGDGRVLDRRGAPRRIFTLGALRRGELFESTAVPEIRNQAATIAAAAMGAVAVDAAAREVRT